jgi:penicillin-insensitive murein endopeptidase
MRRLKPKLFLKQVLLSMAASIILAKASTVLGSESIGGTSNGCLLNAASLPLTGNAHQVMNASRQRFYGHAQMVRLIKTAADFIEQNKLGVMLVGDVAAKNGGPMLDNHKSHQNGLDADIFFMMPDQAFVSDEDPTPEATTVIDFEKNRVDSRYWSDRQSKLLKFFASDPLVDRIFVNAAIKKSLCEAHGDKKWLAKIRPWREHTEHFHVRLKCPSNSPDCVSQAALPEKDGCDDEMLSYWLAENINPTISEQVAEPVLVKPLRCQAQ